LIVPLTVPVATPVEILTAPVPCSKEELWAVETAIDPDFWAPEEPETTVTSPPVAVSELPATTPTLPPPALMLDPTATRNEPAVAEDPDTPPVFARIRPVAPSAELPVWTLTVPLTAEVEDSNVISPLASPPAVNNRTCPPVCSIAAPALSEIEPPAPLEEDPTATKMLSGFMIPEPPAICIFPELPESAAPVFTVSAPLSPREPASSLRR
jgi:hypothetical protein